MDLVGQLSAVSGEGGVGQAVQVFSLNAAKSATANAVLPLLAAAVQQSVEIRSLNPAHLGQSIDVKA